MRIEFILVICACAFFVITFLFITARKYSKRDFSTKFFFKEEDYEDKEIYALYMSKGIRTLAVYLMNCTFIFIMSTLANTLNYYMFALLFLATTLVSWYVMLFKQLERYQKKVID